MSIINPILPGFNPDPSILRVGDDYYIATSTFEWFPGVQIHHSKDLVHWKLIARPLNRLSQLNMAGNPNSCGIWAPCLSFHEGTFYLVYSDVKTFRGEFKDVYNFLVTSENILGEWSEPVYLNSSGFDPSLFHDTDGRKWLVNMLWDHRKGKQPFGGILLQEYSHEKKKLTGPVKNIFQGTDIQKVEGPHLYKRNGYYYLLTAEGGTVLRHSVTMARSKKIDGPYQVDPENPVLTSYFNPELKLQRAGHASLVDTQNGEWYMTHLCGRHVPSRGRCTMGRETAIQKMKWTDDGWIRLEGGGNEPLVEVPAPKLPLHKWGQEPVRDDFNGTQLNIHFQSLRIKLEEDTLSLTEKPGFLRLKGRESLNSHHTQALVARRQQSFFYTAETCIDFQPDNFQQMAGLICLYDNRNYYYLYITYEENIGRCLDIMWSMDGVTQFLLEDKLSIVEKGMYYLKADVQYDKLRFFHSADGKKWNRIGPDYDYSTLSDEFEAFGGDAHFTGSFVGICCQDLLGSRKAADFDYFEYRENKNN